MSASRPDGLLDQTVARPRRQLVFAFVGGALVAVLAGMIGLGGAEFRLPILVSLFGFVALQAIIINKTMSIIVVITAIPARLIAVPIQELASHWGVAVNLLAGSLIAAWIGASWATRMRSATLYRVLAVLLVLIAAALAWDQYGTLHTLQLAPVARIVLGVVAGAFIGFVAALMGVAGGELLIPAIVLLFGIDLKTAGSLSLIVSLPTMLVAFFRYSRDANFRVLRANWSFVLSMTAGSILGTILGGLLLGVAPAEVILPLLILLLLGSAYKVWRHD